MSKVSFPALWSHFAKTFGDGAWRTIRRWMDSLLTPLDLRTLIRAHAAEALEKARLNHGFIGFEERALLYGSFRLKHPDIEVGWDLFAAELNYALGRPYFLIRTAR